MILLGWREWVALPALGIDAVRAKVDTGARSSALHVDAQRRYSEGGAPWVMFRLRPSRRSARVVEAHAPVHDERNVQDSGGHGTRRVFLRTTLRLAGIEREIEINLTDRGGMLFPMLLGRTALAGAFGVDPALSSLHGKPLRDPPIDSEQSYSKSTESISPTLALPRVAGEGKGKGTQKIRVPPPKAPE